jgi:hypothetical protein
MPERFASVAPWLLSSACSIWPRNAHRRRRSSFRAFLCSKNNVRTGFFETGARIRLKQACAGVGPWMLAICICDENAREASRSQRQCHSPGTRNDQKQEGC